MQICDISIKCLRSKSDRFVFAFSHNYWDFQCLILSMIKKYSLLVKLNQCIKQLGVDRNGKKLIWLKTNLFF